MQCMSKCTARISQFPWISDYSGNALMMMADIHVKTVNRVNMRCLSTTELGATILLLLSTFRFTKVGYGAELKDKR